MKDPIGTMAVLLALTLFVTLLPSWTLVPVVVEAAPTCLQSTNGTGLYVCFFFHNDTWTPPSNITGYMVSLWGGGGGGAARSCASYNTSGGGSGSAIVNYPVTAAPGQIVRVIVGQGGAGGIGCNGTSANTEGGNGGDTIVMVNGITRLVAYGGAGGVGSIGGGGGGSGAPGVNTTEGWRASTPPASEVPVPQEPRGRPSRAPSTVIGRQEAAGAPLVRTAQTGPPTTRPCA